MGTESVPQTKHKSFYPPLLLLLKYLADFFLKIFQAFRKTFLTIFIKDIFDSMTLIDELEIVIYFTE